VLTNSGARVGDRLLLTKALGTGVISTAIKKQKAEPAWIDAAVQSMTTLNKAAAEIITGVVETGLRPAGNGAEPRPRKGFDVRSITDITGFGLIGHAREMALGSGVSLRISAGKVPLLTGALDCVRAGYVPGGLNANRDFAECVVAYDDAVPDEVRTILFDPQTAGGLLISVAAEDAEPLTCALNDAGVPAVEIGKVLTQAKPLIQIT
jgi:selenide,water dikinase